MIYRDNFYLRRAVLLSSSRFHASRGELRAALGKTRGFLVMLRWSLVYFLSSSISQLPGIRDIFSKSAFLIGPAVFIVETGRALSLCVFAKQYLS